MAPPRAGRRHAGDVYLGRGRGGPPPASQGQDEGKPLRDLRDFGCTGKLHAVNPTRHTIQGMQDFRSVKDISGRGEVVVESPEDELEYLAGWRSENMAQA